MIPSPFGSVSFAGLAFPGAAGEAQTRGAIATLVRELGDNYVPYHLFLAEQLASLEVPDPARFSDIDAYLEAWGRIYGIVRAEAFLRNCLQYRRDHRPLNLPTDPSLPLVDDQDRLVNFVHPVASREEIVRARYKQESQSAATSTTGTR